MIQMDESLMYYFKSEIYKFLNTYVIVDFNSRC